jgi:hypothetical protein
VVHAACTEAGNAFQILVEELGAKKLLFDVNM